MCDIAYSLISVNFKLDLRSFKENKFCILATGIFHIMKHRCINNVTSTPNFLRSTNRSYVLPYITSSAITWSPPLTDVKTAAEWLPCLLFVPAPPLRFKVSHLFFKHFCSGIQARDKCIPFPPSHQVGSVG